MNSKLTLWRAKLVGHTLGPDAWEFLLLKLNSSDAVVRATLRWMAVLFLELCVLAAKLASIMLWNKRGVL